MLSQTMPDLVQHLRDMDLDLALLVTQWSISLFADVFPSESVLQLWAALVHHGRLFVYRIIAAVIGLLEADILQVCVCALRAACVRERMERYACETQISGRKPSVTVCVWVRPVCVCVQDLRFIGGAVSH